MNKVFKIVFNAARGKMMVVNEATSSVQTGKKAAVTVAVIGALASGVATADVDVAVDVNIQNPTDHVYQPTDSVVKGATGAENVSITLGGNGANAIRVYGGELTVKDLASFNVDGTGTNNVITVMAPKNSSAGKLAMNVGTFQVEGAYDDNAWGCAAVNVHGGEFDLTADTVNIDLDEGTGFIAQQAGSNSVGGSITVNAKNITVSTAGGAGVQAAIYGNSSSGAENNTASLTLVATDSISITSETSSAVQLKDYAGSTNAGKTFVDISAVNDIYLEGYYNGIFSKHKANAEVSESKVSVVSSNGDISVKGKGEGGWGAVELTASEGVIQAQNGTVTLASELGYGIKADNGDLTVDANKINITAATVGVNARNTAQVMLGTDETDTVAITVNPTDSEGVYAMGIQVRNPDTDVTVKGNQLNVTVGGDDNDTSVGVLVQGNADGKSGTKMGELNLASANTKIVAVDNAMAAYAAGVLNVTGNLVATAENVVEARGQSTVNINTAGGKDVVLNGDINFNKGAASGTDAWADVNVVLDTANSVWNGNVKATWDVPATDEDFVGSKLNLTLANGAQWNPQAIATEGTLGQATTFALRRSGPTESGQSVLDINNMNLEGGVINLEDGVQVGVENMGGSGGTVNLGTSNGETGAGLDVGNLADETKLDVNLMNADLTKELTSDDLTPEQTQELLKNVAGGGANVTTDVAEGQYNDGYSANGKDGVVATTKNSIMSNTLDLASSAPLAMNRLLMNDVRKRVGDLRAAEGTHGVWARYDGGKLSGERGLENDFTTVQVGIDTVPVVDAPRFGVAFAYTKSDADMLRGSADMDAFSLAFYGTKFYDNGMFVDVIGRMATADTDVTVEGQKGTMDNVALSLSGELGWRFDVTEKFYFEPQAELTYTYVNADKLALGSSSYQFDSVDSLMARVGFAAGFKCPSNFGDVYVRASAVHEFLGDSAVTGGNGTIHEVDGEDTWVEFGIGANFNINKNTYVYADIERTEGAKLEEDWRANVGVRFAF